MPSFRPTPALVAAIAGLTSIIGSAPRAHALCDAEPPGLLWSYPANGAVDVPIDADLIVTGSLFGAPTLNGTPLTLLESGVYELGELAPATRYEVRWDTAVIAFETGSERTRGSSPSFETRDLVVSRSEADVAPCPLVPSQGCFDTGAPTTVTIEPPRGSLAWLVDRQFCDGSTYTSIVPSGCRAPFIQSEDRIVCARLRATNGATIGDPTGLFCSVPDVPLQTIPMSSSCVGAAWPPADALVISTADGDSSPSESASRETGCGLTGALAPGEPVANVVLVLGVAAVVSQMRRRRPGERVQAG